MGNATRIDSEDEGTGKIQFMFDVQRKTLNIRKCTYQTRSQGEILLRLDLEGAPHPNPDGTEVSCPHLHIYREGFGDRWAYPLSDYFLTNTHDLVQVLLEFLKYNHVEDLPEIIVQGGGLV